MHLPVIVSCNGDVPAVWRHLKQQRMNSSLAWQVQPTKEPAHLELQLSVQGNAATQEKLRAKEQSKRTTMMALAMGVFPVLDLDCNQGVRASVVGVALCTCRGASNHHALHQVTAA
eukprot:1137585-Pelagomonas_calceolata.AAC.3